MGTSDICAEIAVIGGVAARLCAALQDSHISHGGLIRGHVHRSTLIDSSAEGVQPPQHEAVGGHNWEAVLHVRFCKYLKGKRGNPF